MIKSAYTRLAYNSLWSYSKVALFRPLRIRAHNRVHPIPRRWSELYLEALRLMANLIVWQ